MQLPEPLRPAHSTVPLKPRMNPSTTLATVPSKTCGKGRVGGSLERGLRFECKALLLVNKPKRCAIFTILFGQYLPLPACCPVRKLPITEILGGCPERTIFSPLMSKPRCTNQTKPCRSPGGQQVYVESMLILSPPGSYRWDLAHLLYCTTGEYMEVNTASEPAVPSDLKHTVTGTF